MWRLSFSEFSLVDRRMPLLFGRNDDDLVGKESTLYQHEDVEPGFLDGERRNAPRRDGANEWYSEQVDRAPRGEDDFGALQDTSATAIPPPLSKQNHQAPVGPQPRQPSTHLNSLSTVSSAHFVSTPFTSQASTLMDSKDGFVVAEPPPPNLDAVSLPPKKYSSLLRNARYTWFTVYRRLNILSVILNVACMTVLGAKHRLLQLPLSSLATAATANILLSILIRQELVINSLFILASHCPKWMPLRIRRLCAKIYHLGGVHSGAATAGTIWFLVFSAVMFMREQPEDTRKAQRTVMWAFTATLDLLLVGICAMAYPTFRQCCHNWFEGVHRFAGWFAISLFWALFIMLCEETKNSSNGRSFWSIMLTAPVFYMLSVITICLIAPWLNLRRVPVIAERLSDHAIRLHFSYTDHVPLCSAPRITDRPLREWHAFASIPEDDGKGFSVLVSRAGDWTSRIINNPPNYLYKRGWLARGVMNVAPMFKPMVIVCTGSGIGPVLSLLKGAPHLKGIRLIWSTKDPLAFYRKSILDDVYNADPEALVINTGLVPRPNLVPLAYRVYSDSRAEAVFVISNPRVTREVVYGLESRGVPTFSPIFDS